MIFFYPLVRGVTSINGQLDGYPAVTLFSFLLLSTERLLGLSRGINFKAYGDMHFIRVRCAILECILIVVFLQTTSV